MKRRVLILVGLALPISVCMFLIFVRPECGDLDRFSPTHQSDPSGAYDTPMASEKGGLDDRIILESSSSLSAGNEDSPGAQGENADAPGWLVEGLAISSYGDPVRSVGITLHYWGLPDTNVKGSPVHTITDEDGFYLAFVPIPGETSTHAPSRSFPGIIVGDADASGFIPAGNDSEGGILVKNHPSTFMPLLPSPLPRDCAHTLRVDFLLKEGAVARGRVVTTSGDPVQRARINVKSDGGQWEFGGVTEENGQFFLPIDSAGYYSVSAEKDGVGVAGALSFIGDEEGGNRLPDLILIGSESLSGLVQFPDGTPVRGVEINAKLKKTTKNRDTDYIPVLGCTGGHSITDDKGCFGIDGLHPGRYKVEPRIPNDFLCIDATDLSLFEQFHDTGTSGICFVLPIHMLQVCLRDSEGHSLPGQVVLQPGFSTNEVSEENKHVVDTSSGSIDLQILPGSWTAWGFSNYRQPAKKSISISDRNNVTELELVLPYIDLSGELGLSVTGTDGKPVKRIGYAIFEERPKNRESLESLFPIIRESLSDETGNYEFPVPSRSFLLSIWARGVSTIDGIPFPGSSYHSKKIEHVAVTAGERIELNVTLEQGGLVRVTLHFDRSGTNFINVGTKIYDINGDNKIVFLSLAAPGSTERVRRTELESGVRYLGLKLLRPGLHRLEVKTKGYPKRFKKAEVHFTVLPGKVTDVEVWIEEE